MDQTWNRDHLLYPTDSYLMLALDNHSDQTASDILNRLISKYKSELIAQIQSIKDIQILNLDVFLTSKEFLHSMATDFYRGFNEKTALRIEVFGNIPTSICPIFFIIEKFLRQHPVELFHLTPAESSKYQAQDKVNNFPAVLIKRYEKISLIVYDKIDTRQLMEKLKKQQWRIAKGTLIQTQNTLEVIYFFKQFFTDFIKQNHIKVHNLIITRKEITFNGQQREFQKFKQRANYFLRHFDSRENQINLFKNYFEKIIFMQIYASHLKIANIKLYPNTENMTWSNCLNNFDEVQATIEKQYIKMLKSLVLIPSTVKIDCLPKYMRYVGNKQASIASMIAKVYQINKKFRVILKSQASIFKDEGTAVFLVHFTQKCSQFTDIMEESNLSPFSLKQNSKGKKGDRYLQFTNLHTRYFSSIIGWSINMVQKNADRIKRDLNYLLDERFRHQDQVKIVIPKQSQQLINFIMPLFFQKLLDLSLQSSAKIVKTVDFIMNTDQADQITNFLFKFLKNLRESQNLAISVHNLLLVNKFNIQKIVEFRYATIKCLTSKQIKTQLSATSSFVVCHEFARLEISRRVIISYNNRQDLQTQFVLDCYFQKIVTVKQGTCIKEVKWADAHNNIRRMVKVIKSKFKNMDMLILYGNDDGSQVYDQFYYTKIENNQYQKRIKKFKVSIEHQLLQELQEEGILEVIFNRSEACYLVETHQKYEQEAKLLIRDQKKQNK